MDSDELGAVWKRCFHLHVVEHLRHSLHHVVAAQHVATADHQLGDGATVARAFKGVVADDCNVCGWIEAEAAGSTSAGQLGGVGQQQQLLLVRRQAHILRSCHATAVLASNDQNLWMALGLVTCSGATSLARSTSPADMSGAT